MSDDNGNDSTRPKAVPVEPPASSEGEPKKRRGRPPGSIGNAKIALIENSLNELLTVPAMAFASMGDQQCAWILAGDNSPGKQWSKSMANLAKQSVSVRNVLLKLTEGGAWGGVIVSTLMVSLPIAAHHGALPERFNILSSFIMDAMPEDEAE